MKSIARETGFINHGNKKLKDFADGFRDTENPVYQEIGDMKIKYVQFNLPAISTCPNASAGCIRFCYAKRDERYPLVREIRAAGLEFSRRADFVERMIEILNAETARKKYENAVCCVRLHESGDFYSVEYLEKWIDIMFAEIENPALVFQAYTKSFSEFVTLDREHREKLSMLLDCHKFGLSLSKDDTQTQADAARIEFLRELYPNVNVYYCTAEIPETADYVCDCAECAKCAHCIHTMGHEVVVKIH